MNKVTNFNLFHRNILSSKKVHCTNQSNSPISLINKSINGGHSSRNKIMQMGTTKANKSFRNAMANQIEPSNLNKTQYLNCKYHQLLATASNKLITLKSLKDNSQNSKLHTLKENIFKLHIGSSNNKQIHTNYPLTQRHVEERSKIHKFNKDIVQRIEMHKIEQPKETQHPTKEDTSIIGTLKIPLQDSKNNITLGINDDTVIVSKKKHKIRVPKITFIKKPLNIAKFNIAQDLKIICTNASTPSKIIKALNISKAPNTSRNNAIKVTYTDALHSYRENRHTNYASTNTPRNNESSTKNTSLMPYELKEMQLFSQVYYYASLQYKKEESKWDDELGFYQPNLHDHIGYRYEIIELIGKGSFGVVYKCYDHKTKSLCSIKILRSKENLQKQGMVEAELNQVLSKTSSQYFPKLQEILKFRGHICIVSELLKHNLYDIIEATEFQV